MHCTSFWIKASAKCTNVNIKYAWHFHIHCANLCFFPDCHHLGMNKYTYLYLLVLDQGRWADTEVFAHTVVDFWMGRVSWPQQCVPVTLPPEEQFYRPPGLGGTGRITVMLCLLSIRTQVSNGCVWLLDVVLFHGSAELRCSVWYLRCSRELGYFIMVIGGSQIPRIILRNPAHFTEYAKQRS